MARRLAGATETGGESVTKSQREKLESAIGILQNIGTGWMPDDIDREEFEECVLECGEMFCDSADEQLAILAYYEILDALNEEPKQ